MELVSCLVFEDKS